MTATPFNTSVARPYLTDEGNGGWVPEKGTIVFADGRGPRRGTTSACGLEDTGRSTGAAPGSVTEGAGGSAAACGWSGEGPVADQRPAGPADHPVEPLRQPVQPVLPLLLRQVRPGPGARAGLRAHRRPGPDVAGQRPAAGARPRSPGGGAHVRPGAHPAGRHLGAGLAGRHRRGAAQRRGARPRRRAAVADVRPAGVDPGPAAGCRAAAGHRRREPARPARRGPGLRGRRLVGVQPLGRVGLPGAVRLARRPGGHGVRARSAG